MTKDEFLEYVEDKTYPFKLLENSKAQLSLLYNKYPEDLLLECVDIGISQYYVYSNDGELEKDSVEVFLKMLGGILHNRSLSPIQQEIKHIINRCKRAFAYWNDIRGEETLLCYVSALRDAGWSDEQILDDLQTEVLRVCNSSRSWTQWRLTMEKWISDIEAN